MMGHHSGSRSSGLGVRIVGNGAHFQRILCLKRLAHCDMTDKVRRALCKSVPAREWILGSFYWRLWRARLDLAHNPDSWVALPALAASIELDFSLGPH